MDVLTGAPAADNPTDQPVWNYLAKLGLVLAIVVAGAAVLLLAYAYLAFCYLASL